MSEKYKQERIVEYEKMLEALKTVSEFIGITISRFEKKLDKIDHEEMYEEGVIKNMTETVISIEFAHNGREKGSSIIIKDYLYKSEIKREYLNSPELRRLYRQNLIKDITEGEMLEEKKNKKSQPQDVRSYLEPCSLPVGSASGRVGNIVADRMVDGISKNMNTRSPVKGPKEVKRVGAEKPEECEILSKEDIQGIISNQFGKESEEEIIKKRSKKKPAKKKPAKKKPAKKKPAKKPARKKPARKKPAKKKR